MFLERLATLRAAAFRPVSTCRAVLRAAIGRAAAAPVASDRAAVDAARAELVRVAELLQEQAVELEQQLEESRALSAENERLLGEVQAREARFRGLVEAAHEGVWALDQVGQTTYVNPRLCALLGVSAGEMNGRSFFDFLGENSAFEARTRFARPQRGLVDDQDLVFRRADGSTLVGRVAVSPIPDVDGGVAGVLVLVHDVTEQHRAEAALRESAARFRELFERNPLPMWVYAPDTLHFLAVNDAAVRHYGWTRDEFLAMTLDDVRPADARGLPAQHLEPLRAAAWRGHGHATSVVHRTKDGRRCDVEVTADAVTFDGRTARLALLHDVTERIAAERALHASNERFDLVQRATNDVIWDRDLLTDRVVWSGGLQSAFGYRDDERAEAPDWWRERVHPADHDRVLDTVHGALLRGDASWEAEYRFRRGDGAYARVIDRGCALRDASGTPVRLIGAMQDVSDRDALGDQLRQAQRMETVGRLAGGVAHDFNNLLVVITANTEFALEQLPPDGDAAGDLHEALDAARRAAGLTRQLLTFSRKQVWQPQVVDINRTVENLQRLFHRLIGEDVAVTTALAASLWPVLVDPGQLEQVLANLIVNARDAMPDGGSIQLATAALTVDAAALRAYATAPRTATHPAMSTLAPGEYVALTVADTGVGIPDGVLPHVFEPFYTTKPEGKGTGLGLSTSCGIVQQAGGAIALTSSSATTATPGTVVTVLLPRHHVSDLEPGGECPSETPRCGGDERVLVVEDEPAVRSVVRRVLASAGYTVLEAPNGAEALDIWHRQVATGAPVDLVLTDAVMPQVGGHALAERLRAEQPDVRVVLMSGYIGESGGDPARARAAASAFLQKPLSVSALLRTLRDVLDARAAPEAR